MSMSEPPHAAAPVCPPPVRRVRVARLVAVDVVAAVVGDPAHVIDPLTAMEPATPRAIFRMRFGQKLRCVNIR